MDLLVKVEAAIDGAGKVTWDFTSLDPATGAKTTDAVAGFLPPNADARRRARAASSYAVSPKAGIASGTDDRRRRLDRLRHQRRDRHQRLVEPDRRRRADRVRDARRRASCAGIAVAWSGTDAASGVALLRRLGVDDGGAWTPWQHADHRDVGRVRRRRPATRTGSTSRPATSPATSRAPTAATRAARPPSAPRRRPAAAATARRWRGGVDPPPPGGGGDARRPSSRG